MLPPDSLPRTLLHGITKVLVGQGLTLLPNTSKSIESTLNSFMAAETPVPIRQNKGHEGPTISLTGSN